MLRCQKVLSASSAKLVWCFYHFKRPASEMTVSNHANHEITRLAYPGPFSLTRVKLSGPAYPGTRVPGPFSDFANRVPG